MMICTLKTVTMMRIKKKIRKITVYFLVLY